MAAPAWQAATTGYQALAGSVNQLLLAHAVTYVYTGAEQASQGTAGSGSIAGNSLYLAQSFTMGASQTTTGYAVLKIGLTGSPSPWTISLEADNGSGAPTGTALVSTQVPKEFTATGGGEVTVILPATGLTASGAYWLVAAAQGDSGDHYRWFKSNQTSGASTSPDGVTWTAQTYGFLFEVFDGSPVLPLAGTWEDSGDRWTSLSYTSGQLTGLGEFTVGQTANGYVASTRTLSYSGALLTGVA